MNATKYAIQIVKGDAAIVGFYVRKGESDPSGLREGICFTGDRRRARLFRDHEVAERFLSKLAARGSGSSYEIVEASR